ncbi:MAG TPA: ATP-binding protein [Longimicrobiales bacterium]|nr:ATP-binding protein [Longimicrobiales bacterium]
MTVNPVPPSASPPDVLILLDSAGLVRYMSPSGAEFLGLPDGNPIGRRLLSVTSIHPEDRQETEEAFARMLGGEPGSSLFEVRIRNAAGHWRRVRVSVENLLDDPAIRRLVLHATDLTAHRELEEQLLRSQRLQAVGRLAGGVAHDFRNVLTVIRSSVELARGELTDGHPALSELDEITAAAERATSLTQQLLSFSRREHSAGGPADVHGVLEGLRGIIRRLLGETLGLEISACPDLPPVAVDPGRLEQVILNLASNARDAMNPGKTLYIRASAVQVGPPGGRPVLGLEPGEYVVVTAEDEGSGMDAETLGRIFEPFFSTRSESEGTGLGLATIYSIVTQAGGQVSVNSQVGRGTTFRVYLPIAGAASGSD